MQLGLDMSESHLNTLIWQERERETEGEREGERYCSNTLYLKQPQI